MRAVVYGHERTVKKVMALLVGEGVLVEAVSDRFCETVVWPVQGEFDLAIVDSQAETAEAACHHLRRSGDIPLVLIVDPRQADWNGLKQLNADGYLPTGTEDGELSARMRAVLRRCRSVRQSGVRNQDNLARF